MTDDDKTEIALTAIYTDALKLAAERLKKIEAANTSDDDVDRGARCARTLVITAKEVNALQAQAEKDAPADDAEAIAREREELERVRDKTLADIERIESADEEKEAGESEDCSDQGRRGGQS